MMYLDGTVTEGLLGRKHNSMKYRGDGATDVCASHEMTEVCASREMVAVCASREMTEACSVRDITDVRYVR